VVLEQRPDALQGQVVAAERRARIAGDERAGAQPAAAIAAVLIERQPDQRLDPGEVHAALLEGVPIVQS
jgi:hypothetical protein